MHRASAGFLAASQFRRIEAFVDPEFKPAMRWIKMLGFELERFVPYFFKDGSIASQWAMHK
jgi:hypothetical protein